MNPFMDFGISFITAFQSWGTWLEAPMKFFSFVGGEEFFLIFLPLLYWSIDAALGVRAGFILLVGAGLNQLVKMSLHGSRPYWVTTQIRGLESEVGFGIPSAHAQVSAGGWGMVAAYYRKAWVYVAAVLLVFFIGISRLYLGMHFLGDVVLGWLLGFITLWVVVRFWEPVVLRLKKMSLSGQIVVAFAASLAMLLLGALIVWLSRNVVLPAEWIANAIRDGNEAPNPFSLDDLITGVGTLFGLSVGLAWMRQRGGFNASGSLWKRAARYVLGLIGVLLLYAGLKAVFPSGDTLLAYTFRYLRYTLLGFWVFGAAPWAFRRLNLAEGG
jgi:membrane-associated phospholipid phosphatase